MEEINPVQRRIKHQQLRRKARRGEIALRRLYKFIRFLIILSIFYGVYRFTNLHYWDLPSDIYNNKNYNYVEILGNSLVKDEKILEKMKTVSFKYKKIYQINPATIETEIEKLVPIKRAYVRRYWFPARFVIMVEEVMPAITISPSETAPDIVAFSFDAELIPREYLPLPDNSNAVKILSYGTKGDDYEKWDGEKINSLYKLAKLLEEYSGEKVLYLDMRNPHNVFAQLESVKIRLGEVDVNVFERIKSVRNILPEVKHLEQKVKYIDLSWKKSKYIKLDE